VLTVKKSLIIPAEVWVLTCYCWNVNLQWASYPQLRKLTLDTCLYLVTLKYVSILDIVMSQ
jgi:hypothetical protein